VNEKVFGFKRTVLLFFILCGTALAAERNLTFVMWSDIHFGAYDEGSTVRTDVIKTINNMINMDFPAPAKIKGKVGQPSFLISLGDTTENGKELQWDNPERPAHWSYLQTVKQLNRAIKTYEVVGNHDSRQQENLRHKFKEKYGNVYYSFNEQGVHFVALDPYHWCNTPKPNIDDEQFTWLKKDLDALPQGTPIVMAMHMFPDAATGDRSCHLDPENSKKLADIVKGKNIIAWLHGHFHSSGHQTWEGFDLISTGFCYSRKGCQGGSPMIMVIRIGNGRITAIDYNWETKQWDKVYLDKQFKSPGSVTTQAAKACMP
jgi:Icc-related predicted phosphoesterase